MKGVLKGACLDMKKKGQRKPGREIPLWKGGTAHRESCLSGRQRGIKPRFFPSGKKRGKGPSARLFSAAGGISRDGEGVRGGTKNFIIKSGTSCEGKNAGFLTVQ